MKKKRTVLLLYIVNLILGLLYLSPLIWMVVSAFKPENRIFSDMSKGLAAFLPAEATLDNFRTVFLRSSMPKYIGNSIFYVSVLVLLSLLVNSAFGYALAKFNFKGKKLILFMYLFVSIIPMEVSQVSTFKIIASLGLYNTRLAPILLYLGADVLMVYLYLQVLEKIPREIDKAAMLEGASYFQIYRKVIFPLLKPATASIIMLKVISIYNDFYIPHLYMPGEHLNTISTALFNFMGPHRIEWNVINAAIILSLIPMLVFFLILQKQIYTGLTAGSIK